MGGNPQQRTVQFRGEDYKILAEIAAKFIAKGISGNPPRFVTITGGTGAGKTTIRRRDYSDGYVNFDYGEIARTVVNILAESYPKLTSSIAFVCDMILAESIEAKKNIVVEIIGDKEALITPVIDAMLALGYNVSISFVDADPLVAWKRHLKAAEEDEKYLSATYTQEATLSYFFHHLGLENMPVTPEA